MTDGRTDGRTDRRTDRRTDGRTDGGDCNIPDAFLKKRGDNYSVDKEPDYLQINVFSRTSKGNIIYTRQNKNLLFMVTFGAYSILSFLGIFRSIF